MDTQQEERVDLILHFGTFPAKSHHSPWVLLLLEKPNRNIPVLALKRLFFVGGGECFNLHSVALLLFSCPLSPSPCSKDGAGLVPDSCGAEGAGNAAQPGLTFAWAPKFPGSGCGSLVSPGALLRAGIPQPLVLLTLTAGLAQ